MSIKSRIRKWLNSDDGVYAVKDPGSSSSSLNASCTRFSVYKADSGFVVEVRPDDNSPNRYPGNENKLYIVQENSDLGAELSKILMLESLRR